MGLKLIATGAVGTGILAVGSSSAANAFFPATEVTGTMYLTTNLGTSLGTFIIKGTTLEIYASQNFQALSAGALRVGHPSSSYGAILGSYHKN